MPFRVISGKFFCVNYAPDGDTIRFQPDNRADLALLEGVPARLNMRGHASVRFEGIDALETHFENTRQPLELARRARQAMLEYLGFRNIVWDSAQNNVISADDAVPGYLLARSTEKFGRIVAFVFPGAPAQASGSEVFVDPAMLQTSANVMLLDEGLAYATYYWSLFADLRTCLTAAVDAARHRNAGVYATDTTNSFFPVRNIGDLTEVHVIMPKLFRRSVVYVAETGSIDGFKSALGLSREPVFDLQTSNFTHFDTFVEEQAGSIRLTRKPEELVFDPMPTRPGGDFNRILEQAAPL